MALVLRYCILSQSKRLTQEFRLFHHNVSSHTYINSNIKKCGSIVHMKHFSTEDEKIHIYKGTLTKRVRNLKIFSYATSILSFTSQPFIYMKVLEEDNLTGLVAVFAFLNLVAACSPLLVHWLAKRYVTDMYYYPKEDKYVAEVYDLFINKKQIVFTNDEVEIPEIDSMLRCCSVEGHPLLFDEAEFIDPKYYCVIMGYNDPIDFEMGPDAANAQKVKIESTQEQLKDIKEDRKQIEAKQ
ncbi:transmembrane protein 70 homolog, mitochondrial [Megachile rotundata]|uniref:transmembrane protein 70 homolog, mitochondrial n=1 Tax=Megachile rotundata TaxID=143995 RepID=UPI000614FB81|nr:PREDICTED: transmembrane protein 70 homolog, mitochondrial [Megachile rotundata]